LKAAATASTIDPATVERERQSLPQSFKKITDYLFGVANAMMQSASVNDQTFKAFLGAAASASDIRGAEAALKGVKVKGAKISVLSTWGSLLRPDLFMPVWKGVLGGVSEELGIERFVGDDSDPDEYFAFMGDLAGACRDLGISNLLEAAFYLSQYKAKQDTYLLLRSEASSKWNDQEGVSYHFGTNVINSGRLLTGARVVFRRTDDGKMLFTGYGKIGVVEGMGLKVDGERSYFERVAHLEDYQKLDPPVVADAGTIRKLESLDTWNDQNSIVTISKEIFDTVSGSSAPPELDPFQKVAVAHLYSGKNVIFYGSPGTGKTRTAKLICKAVLHGEERSAFVVETANAEWTNADLVMGFRPSGGSFVPAPGFLTRAVERCWERLATAKRPFWLVVDELNRANLDLAFGKVFTLLDLEYRGSTSLLTDESTESGTGTGRPDLMVPYSFRIIGTMNVQDRALLFSLGYAFMRRFAFVKEASQLADDATPPDVQFEAATKDVAAARLQAAVSWLKSTTGSALKSEVEQSIRGLKGLRRASPAEDVATIEEVDLDGAIGKLNGRKARLDLPGGAVDLDPVEALLVIAKVATDLPVVEIGQALVMDAAKFLAVYVSKFADGDVPSVLDEAVCAYVLPQFEFFIPQLRKAKMLGDKESQASWDLVTACASLLGMKRTAWRLSEAKKSFTVLA
jgi:MoxR-like ATPase